MNISDYENLFKAEVHIARACKILDDVTKLDIIEEIDRRLLAREHYKKSLEYMDAFMKSCENDQDISESDKEAFRITNNIRNEGIAYNDQVLSSLIDHTA